LDIRTRHQELLREAGFGPLLGQHDEAQTVRRGTLLERLLLQHIGFLLAAILGL
jgi:hypothetical protein